MLKEHINWVILLRSLICTTFVILLFNANITYAGPWYGYADVVLDYYDSGAGPIPGPYGGDGSPSDYVPVSTDAAIGEPDSYFLSLPTGSYVTVGFIDETIIDGSGDDFYVYEFADVDERADVYISSNLTDFTFIGTAESGSVDSFDLYSIGYTDPVVAVKVVGLDTGGSSPGFDLPTVKVTPGSIGPPANIDEVFICKDSSGNNVAIFDIYGNLFLKGGLTMSATPAVSASDEFVVYGYINENPVEVAIIDTSTGDMKIASGLFLPPHYWTSQTNMNNYSENFIIRDSSGNVKANIDSYGNMYLMGKVYEYFLP